jgi:hypothetical protein
MPDATAGQEKSCSLVGCRTSSFADFFSIFLVWGVTRRRAVLVLHDMKGLRGERYYYIIQNNHNLKTFFVNPKN